MKKYLVAWSPSSFGEADDAPLRLLERVGVEVRPNPRRRRLTEDEAVDHVQDVDGLIAGLEPLTRRVLESAKRLKTIARVGIGTDNIDFEAAEELGISVSNTPGPPTMSVAELTVLAALALSRGLLPFNRALHRGEWKKSITPGLRGSTVLFIGFGRIGRAVARRLSVFGPEMLAVDPVPKEDPSLDVEFVTLEAGLRRADVVTLHAAGRAEILGPRELAMLRPGTILLNSARGELVSEAALMEALDDGRVGSAWFDVFWDEPYTGPLGDYDQVLMTPHVGTYTSSCRREMEMEATRNLLWALDIEDPS